MSPDTKQGFRSTTQVIRLSYPHFQKAHIRVFLYATNVEDVEHVDQRMRDEYVTDAARPARSRPGSFSSVPPYINIFSSPFQASSTVIS